MWGYYGSKSKVVKHYPSPRHERIIEPFAGTAQYALEHWQKEVLLIDKYDVIIACSFTAPYTDNAHIVGIDHANHVRVYIFMAAKVFIKSMVLDKIRRKGII